MEYFFLLFCILVFVFFGFYVMHKIDCFLSSGDFKFYTEEEELSDHKSLRERKKKK